MLYGYNRTKGCVTSHLNVPVIGEYGTHHSLYVYGS
jgi:hypothetical protein